ncbi:hypothetical protein SK128_005836 [Halocaridina rubra]|uniref:Uncharacterized protein n=1 Tax=Halocaridina rubra TaxID=373956 RepID=A0AAN8ZSW3_HALRR
MDISKLLNIAGKSSYSFGNHALCLQSAVEIAGMFSHGFENHPLCLQSAAKCYWKVSSQLWKPFTFPTKCCYMLLERLFTALETLPSAYKVLLNIAGRHSHSFENPFLSLLGTDESCKNVFS